MAAATAIAVSTIFDKDPQNALKKFLNAGDTRSSSPEAPVGGHVQTQWWPDA